MESTCKFERIFFKMLKEDNIAGAGGAYGDGPSMHSIYSPSEPQSKDGYAENDGRNIFGAPKALGKRVQTRKGSTGGKKDKKDKKKEKWLKRKNLYLTGSEDEEGIHKPVKPGILKKRLGKLSCSKVRGAKSKLKDKGTHYAKALQRYLNYHC